jgi:uncharacterized protein (DUF2252 family)
MHMTTLPTAGGERGKAARARVPRSAHAAWEPPPGREDPVAVLDRDDAGRVAELVPVRYERMLVSAFTFYRGAASIMAGDLATTPVSELDVQLCGDAHLSNFGAFAAPDRRIVFDVNDFDETARGPWEWDVKRLATSFAVAGRAHGFTEGQRSTIVETAVKGYRKAMRRFATMGHLDVWYERLDVESLLRSPPRGVSDDRRRALSRNMAKARAKDSVRAMETLTHVVEGTPQIVSDPPLVVRIDELVETDDPERITAEVEGLLAEYRRSLARDRRHLFDGYRFVDLARKVVGVGSVGTRCWIALLVGHDDGDPLFLQFKEAGPSVLEPYVEPSQFGNQGQRVVEGQRLMQAAGDIFLGWLHVTGIDGVERDFYARQLWDCKRSAEVERMGPDGLAAYAGICGRTLARAHARSGDRVAIASYVGRSRNLDRALAEFAEAYADQNERDYTALVAAVDAGRIGARGGPPVGE